MYKIRKMEGDYQVHGLPTCIPREIGVQPSDFHHRLSADCAETAPARSSVFNVKQSFHSVK